MPSMPNPIIMAAAAWRIALPDMTCPARLISALEQTENCASIVLQKELGETQIAEQGVLDRPAWKWPSR